MEKEEVERLLEEVKSGLVDKYGIIINHFQQQIFRYCYHMLDHKQEAEDDGRNYVEERIEQNYLSEPFSKGVDQAIY